MGGPKIDINVFDALGREHQCATIQLDFQLPIRFGLEFNSADESKSRPIIIHRAILGSVERFSAILIEHLAGKWPFWLSPRQVAIVPVGTDQFAYGAEVQAVLRQEGYHCDLATRRRRCRRRSVTISWRSTTTSSSWARKRSKTRRSTCGPATTRCTAPSLSRKSLQSSGRLRPILN